VAQQEKQYGSLLLAVMPAAPPPEGISETVMYLGCHGYKAGLYELTDMNVFEMGSHEKRYVPPRRALPSPQQAHVDELTKLANYVVLSQKCAQNYATPSMLGAAFVERTNRYEEKLYVRKVPILK